MHTLIVICADCKEFQDIKDGQGVSGNSHTLCPKCLEKAKEDIKETNSQLAAIFDSKE